jgi:hypothetical protein
LYYWVSRGLGFGIFSPVFGLCIDFVDLALIDYWPNIGNSLNLAHLIETEIKK